MTTARQIHLVRRPNGKPVLEDFALVEAPVADAADGEIQVTALLMSVDPYMRPRLDADQALDAPLLGGGIGRVTQSKNPKFKEGDLVRHGAGFRETFVSDGRGVSVLNRDPDLPLSVYMHALGGTGITAYGGLLGTGALKDGEQVFVSTAGGAVGSVVAQIAKIKGCYVVGSTGTDEKAAWLRDEVGIDAVINYKKENLAQALKAATPKGIDVYFENVGGAVFDAVLPLLNTGARVPVCGLVSQYNATALPAGPDRLSLLTGQVLRKRLTLRGFIIFQDFAHLYPAFAVAMGNWLAAGKMHYVEEMIEGLEAAPQAFIGLLRGENFGKRVIHVGPKKMTENNEMQT